MDPYRSCEESEDHGRLRWVLLREVGFEALVARGEQQWQP
jgi:hypothetical protein